MASVLYTLFSGSTNETAHNEFVKYSKGIFPNKYLLEAKRRKDAWAIKASAEFANYLVRSCLEKISGSVRITGVIVSTLNIREEVEKFFPVEGVKQFMGIKQLQINADIESNTIIAVMDKYPKAFYALSFANSEMQLKIKAKAPKSAKPAASGEKEVGPNFCSLKTKDGDILRDLFFDIPDFKQVSVRHTIIINEIILPKGLSDPVQIREKAVRKGTITRAVVVDGKEKKSEIGFEA